MTQADAIDGLIEAVRRWRSEAADAPLVVAIEGRGASGKTTLTDSVSDPLDAAVVHTDDFFRPAAATAAASGPPQESDAIVRYYDLARLRTHALEPLLDGHEARFQATDARTGATSDRTVVIPARATILVEGVSSGARPLMDVVDRTVLVRTPAAERLARLHKLVPPQEWDEDWLAAERLYFRGRPASSFDLVLSGSSDSK